MCKTYQAIVAQNVPAYGTMHFEAPDDFAALMTTIRDCNDESHDIEWSGAFDNRIVQLYEVAENGTEREIACDFMIDEGERAWWDKVTKALAAPRQPTEAETLAKAFKRAKRPTCRECGSTALAVEMHLAYWDVEAHAFVSDEACDKGHQCETCGDTDARIDWMIVI